MHLEGKTIREISKEVHMSFRDISKIMKSYDKKLRLQQQNKKEQENNQQPTTKKLSKSSQAYILFRNGKTPVEVAIELNLDFQTVRKYWTEFLRLKNMTKLYNIYIENEFHLDSLFRIYSFMLRNNIPIQDIENVLRIAYDITKLYQTRSNLTEEIKKMEQIKNNYSVNQNTNNYQKLLPLGLPKYCYEELL